MNFLAASYNRRLDYKVGKLNKDWNLCEIYYVIWNVNLQISTYFNKHSTTVWFCWFCSQSEEITYNTYFFYFLWYFSVYFNFSWEIWTKISSKITKKWTFELNWTFLFSSSNTLIILNYFLVNSLTKGQHFQNPTPYGKWMHIIFWDMSKHEICRH